MKSSNPSSAWNTFFGVGGALAVALLLFLFLWADDREKGCFGAGCYAKPQFGKE